jgi:hypothetical protein
MNIEIQVDENGENMLFIVSNTTSKSSAFYHMADSFDRIQGQPTAMGNMNQVYMWKEPISDAGFKSAEVEMTWDNMHFVK